MSAARDDQRAYQAAVRVADKLCAGVGPIEHPRPPASDPDAAPGGSQQYLPVPPGRLAVVIDVDGTLLRSNGSVSTRTIDALSAVSRLGHELFFATGRAVRDMCAIGQLTGHRGRSVCANGAALYDHATDTVGCTWPFAAEALLGVVERLGRSIPDLILAVELVEGLRFVAGFPLSTQRIGGHLVTTVDELLSTDVLQILAWHPWLPREKFSSLVCSVVSGHAEASWGNGLGVVEINAPGVNKGSTVAEIVTSVGLSADSVIAFGDMPNDLALLTWAGTAYAMRIAHPQVLATIAHRAPDNDHDGVACVLEHLHTRASPSVGADWAEQARDG